MTGALLKKQMLEVFAWLYQDKKTGKNRSRKGIMLYGLLYAAIFGFLAVMFYALADAMCAPLVQAGFAWLYMALMGLIAVTLGMFGSVFNTFATLYQAKDNDLLFSMPVPVRTILTARLSGVYVMGLMYELFAIVPAVIVYFMNVRLTFLTVLFTMLIPVILSILILAISCILGYVVAWISSHLKNQKILTVIVSLAFVVGYYCLCGSAGNVLQAILQDPANFGRKVRGVLYPLYHMGLAAGGNAGSMLIFGAIVLTLFCVVYGILAHSFIKLATTNKGAAKKKYIEKRAPLRSQDRALLAKEFGRFLGSPAYMLNCGLGILFMLIAAVFLIIKQDVIAKTLQAMASGEEGILVLIAAAGTCMTTSMNDMTAPSISLEGRNIWLAQVLPVSGWRVLRAKLSMHLLLTLIPAAAVVFSIEWILKPSVTGAVLIPVTTVLYVVLMAALGLACNLKMPNLTWTSEIVPIKQGASVMIALFGGFGIIAILGVGYYLLMHVITPDSYLAGAAAILLLADLFVINWLRKRGGHIFEQLTS